MVIHSFQCHEIVALQIHDMLITRNKKERKKCYVLISEKPDNEVNEELDTIVHVFNTLLQQKVHPGHMCYKLCVDAFPGRMMRKGLY